MRIIGEKLSQKEMLEVKGGAWSCRCLHNEFTFNCDTIADCQTIVNSSCTNGEGKDATCRGGGEETIE
ncbi:hypothetical protein OB69_14525 [Roseivirga seohaensis subsp. aquiponti]|uniref:Bacteriocin n=1 Tax=Roseivirga seohaensis subsp. aquiponti TaxID=1566026 RepID=A0A0L8AIG2_9BACT|nr:hypothetical protein OB69_14525 [Roseivirga seohaensis subsp. aquiponti]